MPKCRKGLLLALALCALLASGWSGVAVAHSLVSQRQEASTAVQIKKLKKQQHKSRTVINYWQNKRHWALFARHDKCWTVNGWRQRKVCRIARKSFAFHKSRFKRLNFKLERLEGPSWCNGLTGNRQLGCQMAADYWASSGQWYALEELWTNESNWHQYANNPSSDACGIPQAMNNCSYGYDPRNQISWGLNYIKSRYGDPASALSAFYSRSPSWY